jgi:hypothetical protein
MLSKVNVLGASWLMAGDLTSLAEAELRVLRRVLMVYSRFSIFICYGMVNGERCSVKSLFTQDDDDVFGRNDGKKRAESESEII